MWKSSKFIIAMSLVAVMLIGGTAGVALAWDGGEGQSRNGARIALMTRVAEILGIEQEDLTDAVRQAMAEIPGKVAGTLGVEEQELLDAFKQAGTEMREEALDNRLQQLLDEGELTQEQVAELEAWIDAKPNMPRVGPGGLQKLVDDGDITQEQADQYRDEFKAWAQERPDDIPMHNLRGARGGHMGFWQGRMMDQSNCSD